MLHFDRIRRREFLRTTGGLLGRAPQNLGAFRLTRHRVDRPEQRRYADGRRLRRYKRRWIVERTNSWLGQFRRLLVRHEHVLSTYRAFFYLACFWITLRHCL
jgi:hypothetical protein